jgi:hypothetical protein
MVAILLLEYSERGFYWW